MPESSTFTTSVARFQGVCHALYQHHAYIPTAAVLRGPSFASLESIIDNNRILNWEVGTWISVTVHAEVWRDYDYLMPGRLLLNKAQLGLPCVGTTSQFSQWKSELHERFKQEEEWYEAWLAQTHELRDGRWFNLA